MLARWTVLASLLLVACPSSTEPTLGVDTDDTDDTDEPVARTGVVACTVRGSDDPFTPARVGIAEVGAQPVWFNVDDTNGCAEIERDAGTWEVSAEALQETCFVGPTEIEIIDGELLELEIDLYAGCMG